MVPKILSIAGFDGSCGAGMQADLKTFSALGCYGLTILTALPVQNTTGVKSVYPLPLQSLKDQLQAMFEDTPVDVIKIGMLFHAEIIETVSSYLKQYAPNTPIVLDPVMMAKSGHALLLPEAVVAMKELLIPMSTIITPNIPEAVELAGKKITSRQDMEHVARDILENYSSRAILLKGGHLDEVDSNDFYLNQNGAQTWLSTTRVQTKNTHGTGCTLSAAIAAYIGLGLDLENACKMAKQYLFQALVQSDQLVVGKGQGPVHHFHSLWVKN